jgi:germination protein M
MKRIVILATALASLATACAGRGAGDLGSVPGAPSPTSSPTEAPTGTPTTDPSGRTFTYQVWFAYGESLFVTERTEPFQPHVGVIAVTTLLGGPSSAERAAGVTTSVPERTRISGLGISENGVATVDLSREFESGGGSASMMMRLAQLTYTLTQFPTVKGVDLQFDGQPVQVFGGEGIVLDNPMTRDTFRNLLPPILVESPLIGQRVSGPITVSGTANVFEATVSISVLDSAGKEIVRTFTTATCGTGCRGTYSEAVRYKVTQTQPGIVRVYESSAEDGEPINVVDIPVTLVA